MSGRETAPMRRQSPGSGTNAVETHAGQFALLGDPPRDWATPTSPAPDHRRPARPGSEDALIARPMMPRLDRRITLGVLSARATGKDRPPGLACVPGSRSGVWVGLILISFAVMLRAPAIGLREAMISFSGVALGADGDRL